MAKCYFIKVDKFVGDEATELVKAGPQGVQTIIKCSRKYDDNLYHELETNIENDSEFSIFTHRSCASTYTSQTHINRFLKRKGDATDCTVASPMKRLTPKFNFQTHCLFCGELCTLKKIQNTQIVCARHIYVGQMEREILLPQKQDILKSKTSHLWIDCVTKAVFIMMIYIRAEREADWCLHLTAVKEMLPYFFAAGHVKYARYGLYYLRTMEALPKLCQEQFLKGEHVMRHVPGLWNGIWSDVHRENVHVLWAWQTKHYWCDIKT